MIGRTLVIARKELIQLRRDKPTLAMMIVLPLVQLMLFGYAINTDVRHIPTVVVDQDRSAQSRDLVRSMEATGFYDIIANVRDYPAISRAFRSNQARVGVVIEAGYASMLRAGRTATVQLVVDGSDPQVVASATNTAVSLLAARSADLSLKRLYRRGQQSQPVAALRLVPTIWYNQDLRTAIYVVPGLIGVILTMTMVMLTSMAIARERERGTLEQLIVSPVANTELMIGKILPYIIIGYVQMTIVLAAGHLIFGVPVVGSLPLLYALAFLFIAANLALGLLFSTLASTQQQAMQMSFFFLLPNILLSGFMFPFEAMPPVAQGVGQALPLTHFLRIVRGITLKGSSAPDLMTEVGWLCALLVVLVTLSSLRFTKKLG